MKPHLVFTSVLAAMLASAGVASAEPTLVSIAVQETGRDTGQYTFNAFPTVADDAPICGSGTFADETYTCADGSGSFRQIRRAPIVGREGDTLLGRGTGRYADLRGKRLDCSGLPTGGTACEYVVDLDSQAPSARMRARAVRVHRRPGSYAVRVSLTARDNVRGNVVAVMAAVTARGKRLVERSTRARNGRAALVVTIRAPRRITRVGLSVWVEDPVGNVRVLTRSVRLPR